jgi:PKD repeat protein
MKKAVLPAKVADISAIASFEKKVVLRWTSVGGDEYRIHWAVKPIVEPTFKLAGFDIPYPDTNRAHAVNIYRSHAIDAPVKPKTAGAIEEVVLGPFPDSVVGKKIYFDVQAVNIVSEVDMARSPLSNTDSIVLNGSALAAGPVFTIDAQNKSGLAPLTTHFTCTVSSGTAASYTWYFGDGTTAATQNPQHVYDNAGDFKVVCVVKDGSGNATSHLLVVSATPHLAITNAVAMGPSEAYVVLNGKLKAEGSSPVVVSLIDKTTGAVLPVTAVKQETNSGCILSFTTAGLVEGDAYEVTLNNMKADVEVTPSADASSFIFTASFKPNRYSVRKINMSDGGYEVTGWEDCHSWDGDYGFNQPTWNCLASWGMGTSRSSALDSLKGSGLGTNLYGDSWFRLRVCDEIKNYRLSITSGALAWAPATVTLKVDDSLVWDSVKCNRSYGGDSGFVYLDAVPWRIENGFLNLTYTELCYMKVEPVTNFTDIAFNIAVEKGCETILSAGLLPNYPNPFNPVTTIVFGTGRANAATLGSAHLRLYDIKGRLVKDLTPGRLAANRLYRVVWEGRDGFGRSVASGVYVVKLTLGNRMFTRKILMIK